MGRGGQPKDRADGPERKCIATGEVRPKALLVRFVIGPDGDVVPDIAAKLPGRGIYVVPDRAAIDRAAKKGLFARVARQQVRVPEDLPAVVEDLIARQVINLVSLARKGGGAVAGYEKVKDRLMRGDVRALLQASDGSERGKSGLSTPEGATYIGSLTADELGQAFSRQTTIHAVLGYGGLAQRVVEEAARLKGLRVSDGGTARRKGK
ncbi:MAG TPA: RNA-binding protein [Roseovarius sp.]|nr:RNA-binding protein [Roseovarius sp.]